MADTLGPRLERIQKLTTEVNAVADDTSRIVQGVEAYLSDIAHVGVSASVVLEADSNDERGWYSEMRLMYGRYGPKYRIFVSDVVSDQGSLDKDESTLWANCPRDVKLMAFQRLPDLLDEIERTLRHTLEQVRLNKETLEALLPPPKAKEKKP
jgi:hypothetical protein